MKHLFVLCICIIFVMCGCSSTSVIAEPTPTIAVDPTLEPSAAPQSSSEQNQTGGLSEQMPVLEEGSQSSETDTDILTQAYTPDISLQDWGKCCAKLENDLTEASSIRTAQVEFDEEYESFYIFIHLGLDDDEVEERDAKVLCFYAILMLNEYAIEYDSQIAQGDTESLDFGGVADRYDIIVDISDANFTSITTCYLQAGKHDPIFF